MDARLTAEQERIQETTRDFIESEGGIELARDYLDGDESVVDELWEEFSALDYTAITTPLEYGGFGEGMVYLCALLEEIGRYALPGPFLETVATAVPLLSELGSEEQKDEYLEAIADGDLKFSFAVYDDRNESVPNAIQMSASRVDDGYRLSGTKTLVPYAGDVDRVIVAARTRGESGYHGISLFIVDPADTEVEKLESLDWTRPLYEMEFDGVEVPESDRLGPAHAGGDALSRALDQYNVGFAAMLVGAADRAVDLSVEYGKERHQYGQPIGRFQAVKHRIVRMEMDKEHSRSIMYYAAWALDNETEDAGQAVAMTKAYAGDRLHEVFANDVKNHGGMGFTWDHDAHIYLKQAKTWQSYLGAPGQAYDRVADIRDYSNKTLPDYPEITTAPYTG